MEKVHSKAQSKTEKKYQNLSLKLKNSYYKLRDFPLKNDLKPYFKILNRINSLDLHSLDDKGLKNKAAWLKKQAAVEEKENISFKSEGSILGSITLQHFFRLYPRLCGMTATARTSAEEFKEFYGLSVVVVPPNCPCIRTDHEDLIYMTRAAKHKALIKEIRDVHISGRPVLG